MSDDETHNKSTVMGEVKHVIDSVLGKFENHKSPTDKPQDITEYNNHQADTMKDEKECKVQDKPTPRNSSTPHRQTPRSLSSSKPHHRTHHSNHKHPQDVKITCENTNGNGNHQEESGTETQKDSQQNLVTPSLDIAFANKLHQRRQQEAKEQNSFNHHQNNNVTPRPNRSSSTPAGTARNTSHYTTPRYSVSPRSVSMQSRHSNRSSSANSNAQILHRAAVVSSVRYFTAKRAASIAHTIGLMDDDSYVRSNKSDNHFNNGPSGSYSSNSSNYNYNMSARYSIRPPSGELTQAEIFALERMAENDARRSENLERAALLEEQRAEYLQQMSEEKSHKAQEYLQELLKEQKERIAALRAWRNEHTSEILSRHEQLEEERQEHYERLIASNASPLDAFQLMYAKQLYQTPQLRSSSPVAPQRLTTPLTHTKLLRDKSENNNNNNNNIEENNINRHANTPGRKHKTHYIENGQNKNKKEDENKDNIDVDNEEEEEEDAEAFLSKHIEKKVINEINKKLDANNNSIKKDHHHHHQQQQRNGNKIERGNENNEHADELMNEHLHNHQNNNNRKVNGSTPLRRRRHSRNLSKTPVRAWH